MSNNIEITPKFDEALREIADGDTHLFITGKAGTGKSTLLRYYCEQAVQRQVVLAPTGIAALNIGGQTIHRFFKFKPDIDLRKIAHSRLTAHESRLYRTLKQIIIDEVSMVRADLLDCVDAFLRRYGPLRDWPFGGVRLVMFGDLYQLPPVVRRDDREMIYSRYGAPYFFASHALRGEALKIIKLDKIFRQRDQRFIALLNAIRANTVTAPQLSLLNSRCQALSSYPDDMRRIVITATNAQAQRINSAYLSRLTSKEYRAKAVIEGQFKESDYPTAAHLTLKCGAKVMMLNNDSTYRWVNGSMAVITDIRVRDGEMELFARIEESQQPIQIEAHTWNNVRYTIQNKEYVTEDTGSFTQFPIRLAWAITVHKSQGKTFSQTHIDLGRRAFAAGQTYVALSRCRTLDNLSLERPVTRDDVYVDRALVDFFERMKNEQPAAKQPAAPVIGGRVSNRKQASEIIALLRRSTTTDATLRLKYIHRNNHIGYRTVIAKAISQKIYRDTPYQALEAYCTETDKRCIFDTQKILDVELC